MGILSMVASGGAQDHTAVRIIFLIFVVKTVDRQAEGCYTIHEHLKKYSNIRRRADGRYQWNGYDPQPASRR